MQNLIVGLGLSLRRILTDESAQDLVEYSLIIAVMAFGAVAGMQSLASGVNVAFNSLSSVMHSTIH
jgi:pilus assembly protein Flp/PilA